MKPGIPASERSRHAYEVRKPGPVRRLSQDEIKALVHKRNLELFLRKRPDRTGLLGESIPEETQLSKR